MSSSDRRRSDRRVVMLNGLEVGQHGPDAFRGAGSVDLVMNLGDRGARRGARPRPLAGAR
jgi:hypothetical protein